VPLFLAKTRAVRGRRQVQVQPAVAAKNDTLSSRLCVPQRAALFSENEVSRCQPDLWAVAYFVVSHREESGLERCDTPNMDTRFPF
jgi:hypothetical protein